MQLTFIFIPPEDNLFHNLYIFKLFVVPYARCFSKYICLFDKLKDILNLFLNTVFNVFISLSSLDLTLIFFFFFLYLIYPLHPILFFEQL